MCIIRDMNFVESCCANAMLNERGQPQKFGSKSNNTRWHLQDSLLVNAYKVQGLVDEVIAQCLEQTLHQRHAEAVNSWPAGGVLGLSGEALLREEHS